MTDTRTDLHKVTVNLIPKADEALQATAERLQLSRTDVINRALQAYGYLEETIANGGDVLIRPKGAEVQRLRFL